MHSFSFLNFLCLCFLCLRAMALTGGDLRLESDAGIGEIIILPFNFVAHHVLSEGGFVNKQVLEVLSERAFLRCGLELQNEEFAVWSGRAGAEVGISHETHNLEVSPAGNDLTVCGADEVGELRLGFFHGRRGLSLLVQAGLVGSL